MRQCTLRLGAHTRQSRPSRNSSRLFSDTLTHLSLSRPRPLSWSQICWAFSSQKCCKNTAFSPRDPQNKNPEFVSFKLSVCCKNIFLECQSQGKLNKHLDKIFEEEYSSIVFEGNVHNIFYVRQNGRKRSFLCVDIMKTNTTNYYRYDEYTGLI